MEANHFMNDEAANPTPAGAVVEAAEPQSAAPTSVKEPAATQSSGFQIPNFTFNVGTTPQSSHQNSQPANIGASGTLPAKPAEVKAPAPDDEEEDEEEEPIEERPVRKDGKRYLSQEKVNAIVATEVEKALKKAAQDAEAQRAEVERQAKEAAATTLEDIRALWQEDKSRLETAWQENASLKGHIQTLEQDLAIQQSRTEGYEELMDRNLDRKVATWPEQLRSLDPKV
jgi:hypothetical protein